MAGIAIIVLTACYGTATPPPVVRVWRRVGHECPGTVPRRRRTAVNDGKGAFRVGDLSAPGPTQPARGAFRVGTSPRFGKTNDPSRD